MARRLNAYIDESGDEGFRKLGERGKGAADASSEWLVLAGVLMFEEQDRERTQLVNRLRDELKRKPPKPLHWRDLRNDQGRKRRAVALMAAEPLHFSLVALWKPGIVGRSTVLAENKGYLYNYAARFLIERLSFFAERARRELNLMFESRATTSYADLERYVSEIQKDPQCRIPPNTIHGVSPVNANRKGAQIADFYASACAEAFERTPDGYIEEEHLLRLKHQLYRPSGSSILGNGLKIFPDDPDHSERLPWLDQL